MWLYGWKQQWADGEKRPEHGEAPTAPERAVARNVRTRVAGASVPMAWGHMWFHTHK